MTRSVFVILGIVAAAFVGFRLLNQKPGGSVDISQTTTEVSLEGKVEELPVEGVNHVPVGQNVDYQTNPPASGNHWPQPANWGFYADELPDEQVVHNLEHGGIWITHRFLSEEEVEKLRGIANRNRGSVIVTPRALNDDRVVVTSWGRMMKLNDVDPTLIQKYIDTFKNNSPEPLAR